MKYLFIDGKFKSTQSDNISTMMQAFNYGTAAFEGMRAIYHKNNDRMYLFRPDQHYQRLMKSTAQLDIDFKTSQSEFVSIISKLITKNKIKSDVYIRPLVYRNAPGVGLTKPSGYGFSIFLQELPHKTDKLLKCCFVSQRRPIDGTYSAKLTGNYVLSFFSNKEAAAKGFNEGILLSTNGYISEASVRNIFFVKNGKLFTPSPSCGALDGITRRTVIKIAREQLGIKIFEGKYRKQRLIEADEIFCTGTGSGICSVEQLEKKRFNLKKKSLLAPQIRDLYNKTTHGKIQLYSDWLVPVK